MIPLGIPVRDFAESKWPNDGRDRKAARCGDVKA